MSKTLVDKYVEDMDHMRLFQQERAIYEVTGLLEDVMCELGVTRTELAKRLGKSKGWVSQMLDGEANKTIRTVADAFAVLGREYRSFQCPIRIGARGARKTTGGELNSEHGTPIQAKAVIKLYGEDQFSQATHTSAETPPETDVVSMAE